MSIVVVAVSCEVANPDSVGVGSGLGFVFLLGCSEQC